MLRIFLFLLLVLCLGFGFSWFADRPGDVTLQWQGNQYETSLMVVLVGVVALIATIMIIWWVGRTILDSPKIVSRFFKARRKDRGYQALTRGLIAANSGNTAGARRYTRESRKLLGDEPLVALLDAQSSLLEGNRDEARKQFEGMLADDDTRLVALRGLYLEAERQGAGDAARHYAEEAHKAEPGLEWAGNAKLRYASQDGNWESALQTLEANRSAGLVDKAEARRQRAVLLTAQAMSEEPADPTHAAKLAREAHKLAPDLVPAAIIGAKALARNNDIGRAAGMLENVWKKQPHPEIAHAYIYLRHGDSAADRLKRARKLAAMKPNHREGNFIIAEAAMDTEDWKLARETMVPVLNTEPSERACLIMADIEEGQSGDQGRMREWLSRALRAPKDAVWTADGYVSEKWLPISPVTGRIDAFEWKVPVAQLGAPPSPVLDAEGLEDLIREPQSVPETVGTVAVTPFEQEGDKDTTSISASASSSAQSRQIEAENGDVAKGEDADDKAAEIEPAAKNQDTREDATRDGAVAAEVDNANSESPPADEPPSPLVQATGDNPKPSEKTEADDNPEEGYPLRRRPDDPGIREEDQVEKPKRFGLF